MKPRVFSFASFQNVNYFALNQLILQLNKLFCFILATRKKTNLLTTVNILQEIVAQC